MNTHKLNIAAELADKVVFLEKGHVCEEGSVEDVLVSPCKEATKRFLSYMKDLYYTIDSPHFDRPELNARIEQYCNRFGLGGQAFRFVQLAVEEALNLIPLEKGLTFKLSKAEQQVRMIIEMTVADSGVSYLDGSSCRDDLSLSILQGLCDVLDERVEKHSRILHMELGQDRLLLK
jgi:polar amino acid transport system ATP-binding protein